MTTIYSKEEFDSLIIDKFSSFIQNGIFALGVLEIDNFSDLRAEYGISFADTAAGKLYALLTEEENERIIVGKLSDSTYLLGFMNYTDSQMIDDFCLGLIDRVCNIKSEPLIRISIGIISSSETEINTESEYRDALDRAFKALLIARREGKAFYHINLPYENKKYRVLLVEDQSLPRQLIENMLKDSNRYEVVNSITNADLAYFYCAKGQIDLVVMDVLTDMGANGLDASARIKKSFPDIKIVIITSMPEVSYLRRAREANVDSFWYKEVDDVSLLEVIDRTIKGECVYPDKTPEVALGLISSYELTEREIEVLRELMSGETNQEIAKKLYISVNTVRDHISNMLLKTGLNSRTELAVRAREIGLVILDRNNADH